MTEDKRKFRETLRLNLNSPVVELLDPAGIVIPDGEEAESTWQRKGVSRQVKMLTEVLKEGFDVFAVLVARLPNGRVFAIDGGQRIRSARAAGCPKITALVYKMDEDDATKAFFALGETAQITSGHKVHHWPGPAGFFIKQLLPQIETRLSASQLVRGLASYLQGKSCMQIQKGLQAIDRKVTTQSHITSKKALQFIEAMNCIFSGIDYQPPTMAILAAVALLNKTGRLPRKGRLSQTNWRDQTNKLGSTQNTMPSWVAAMERGW